MGELSIETAMLIDKLGSAAIMGIALYVLWNRYTSSTDRFVAALTGKLDAVVLKVGDVETAVKTGLAGLSSKVESHAAKLDEHGRTLDAHQKRLDRHAELLGAMSAASGVYAMPRPRVVGEEDPR
jgi:hypothetical protein